VEAIYSGDTVSKDETRRPDEPGRKSPERIVRMEAMGEPLPVSQRPATKGELELWRDIYVDSGYLTEDHPGLVDDGHSSLLTRIVAGGPVFVTPPALAHSYPWVTLWATGAAEIGSEVPTELKPEERHNRDEAKLLVCSDSWALVKHLSDHEGHPAWRARDRRTSLIAVVRWGATGTFWGPDGKVESELRYGIWLDTGPQPTIDGYPVT
jgi:hypothetical protein